MRFLIPSLCLALAATPVGAVRPIEFVASVPQSGGLVIALGAETDLAVRGAMLDEASRAAVARALDSADFDYALESTLVLRGIGPWSQIVLLGTGSNALSDVDLQKLGALAARETGGADDPVTFALEGLQAGTGAAAQIGIGARLGSYSFDRYRSSGSERPEPDEPVSPIRIVAGSEPADAWSGRGAAIADGVAFARDLVSEPANVIYPESFVERTREAFRGLRNVTIEVLDVPHMERLGMNSILSVGKGSARPPRMLIVHYRGASGAPLAFAGKGITFDSGGISLKPGSGMWKMKGDMAGAASVIGATLALARAQAPVNVVAIAALAENMPGNMATRPGDIVKAFNGKTIEILNTDAEGRLVLADAVAYAERQYRPAAIVDVATLTGAKVTALGDEYAALFSRNETLAGQLLAAGEATGDALWRMPLHPSYAKDMKSDFADISNVVEGGRPGAGLGAHFIGAFVTEATPWAHVDMAGNGIADKDLLSPTGVTGFGVKLLERFARDFQPLS